MAQKRTKRTTISRTLADKFTQKLEQLPAKKKTELTPKELIFENLKQLDDLLERGYEYDDLVALLKDDGIKLSKTTLRQYLNEARKSNGQGKTTADKAQQPAKKAPTPPPNNAPIEPLEPTAKKAPEETKRPAKKLGKGRLQSDENLTRYPDGHGQPIEMKADL